VGLETIKWRVGTFVVWWGFHRSVEWPWVTVTASHDALVFRPFVGRGLTVPRGEVTCVYVERRWLFPAARIEATAGVLPRTFRFWRPNLAPLLGDLKDLDWPIDPVRRPSTWP
jgi:hypothetical protein